MRGIVTDLARRLPRKAVAERLLVWVGALVSLAGFLWGVLEYHIDNDIDRTNTTMAFHKLYLDKVRGIDLYPDAKVSEAEALALVQAERCRHLRGTFDLSITDCDNLTSANIKAMNALELDSAQRTDLRKALNAFRAGLRKPDRDRLDAAMAFFRSIVICVDNRTCNAETAIALFAADMTAFVNEICIHAETNAKVIRYTGYLADYLTGNAVQNDIYWGTDRGREDLFACDYLRTAG